MRARIIPLADIQADQVAAWQSLSEHAVEPNPLFEPACLLPAARNLPNGPTLTLLVAEEHGEFVAALPVTHMSPRSRPSISWPGILRPTYSTQVRRTRFDGTPLVRSARGTEAFVAIFNALSGIAGKEYAAALVCEAMRFEGPTAANIVAAADQLRIPLHTVASYERPTIHLGQHADAAAIHATKSLRGWRRSRRLLGETLGGNPRLVDRSRESRSVETLLEMEANSYKGRTSGHDRHSEVTDAGETRGGAIMCWPGEPAWFREMCDNFRSQSRLLLYSLDVNDTTVAIQLMVLAGDSLFALVSAFDEKYARFSPGILLHLDIIQRVSDDTTANWLDSCTYEDNVTLERLFPDRRQVCTVVVGIGRRADRALLAVSISARRYARTRIGIGIPTSNGPIPRAIEWCSRKALSKEPG